jgi:hypothetical protein
LNIADPHVLALAILAIIGPAVWRRANPSPR